MQMCILVDPVAESTLKWDGLSISNAGKDSLEDKHEERSDAEGKISWKMTVRGYNGGKFYC